MMISDDLEAQIVRNFTHEPTKEQKNVIQMWSSFLLSRKSDEIFLLTGYAGTGKTSLVGALVKTMRQLQQPVMLLAPTGRAAKVFSFYAGAPAYTIHRRIYRQKSLTEPDCFQANVNLHHHTLFIVDEASMIATGGLSPSIFGTGRLLDDLVKFVYSCEGCRLMLVGDTAQLPPVGETESPALNPGVLGAYGMTVYQACLTEVVRQQNESGILWNATHLRSLLSSEKLSTFPRLRIQGFPDVISLSTADLIETLEECYSNQGRDETIVITRNNRRANLYNQGIRARLFDYEEELASGDRVMVARNNYYWTKEEKGEIGKEKKEENRLPFIANGDMAIIRRLRHQRELYGFHFADATLRFPDYGDLELEATVLLDTLKSEAPALTHEEQERLFQGVWDDWPEITNRHDRMQRLRQDQHYNALQIKYAYAVTCHKAQGGQWKYVFIDQGYVTAEMLSPDYFRWLYTALTRASERIYLVAWPEEQISE